MPADPPAAPSERLQLEVIQLTKVTEAEMKASQDSQGKNDKPAEISVHQNPAIQNLS